jgi:phosphoglycerol transferase MdoB-like AlkP superfamily enzyme
MNKPVRIISNTIYGIGVATAISLGCVALLGSNQILNPDAMIPFTWREQAIVWLAFGTIPMLLACMAFYRFSAIKNNSRKIRNFILIFFPGFICAACALFIISVLVVGMVNTFLSH